MSKPLLAVDTETGETVMSGTYDKRGCNNPNWKNGICSIKTEEDLIEFLQSGRVKIKDRFLTYVQKTTKCWSWTGDCFNGRYGRFSVGSNSFLSHRISYILFKGIPGELFVLHTCDNIKCVRPGHLFLGTAKDNTQDCISKGRFPDQKGVRNPAAKLTEEDILQIRDLYRRGIYQKDIAKKFGVTKDNIGMIVRRESWKHV